MATTKQIEAYAKKIGCDYTEAWVALYNQDRKNSLREECERHNERERKTLKVITEPSWS